MLTLEDLWSGIGAFAVANVERDLKAKNNHRVILSVC